MPLNPGAYLGPYEIVSQLGAGGMGEVYKARDTRLNRTVAIKVLPQHLSGNPDLRQRFEREAQLISTLNHPHICVLYDVGRQEDVDYLVMEYLEGETLGQRLSQGFLPLDQVMRYSIEIADALDKAHQQGIIHRDLKPSNIMLTKSGAKLLDFGLAKLRAGGASFVGLSALPTQEASLTAAGTILGTFQYMAPEQVEAKEADARTDIFAFGAVLYEMITGRKAFEGKTQASLIGAILEREPPPVSSLQPMTPPALEHVVRTCLAKEPAERWQTAHDVMVHLKWIAAGGSQVGLPAPILARRKSRERLLVSATVLLGLTTIALAGALLWVGGFFSEPPVEVGIARFSLLPPQETTLSPGPAAPQLAVSPDGRKVAFSAQDSSGKLFLWVRPLDSLSAQKLERTEGAELPFWSPDSQVIVFFSGGKLRKVPVTGGSAQTICDASQGEGGSWSREGVIVFAPTRNGFLHRVSANGGVSAPVTKLDQSRQETAHVWPYFLPDSRHFIYHVRSSQAEHQGIRLGSLDSPETRLVLNTSLRAAFAPPDFLLFAREGILMAQRFDPERLELQGEPVSIAEEVNYNDGNGRAAFSVSENGVVAHRTGSAVSSRQLTWFDREGKRLGSAGQPDVYEQIALSPDEKRLAVQRYDSKAQNRDIWLLELSSGIFSRFTFDPAGDLNPIWSPDGDTVAFSSERSGNADLFQKSITSGSEELLFDSKEGVSPKSWSRDNSAIVFTPFGGQSVYSLPLSGDRKPMRVLETPFEKNRFELSPDGRWIAYNSLESGVWEVYVASFPSFAQKRQASNGGGVEPVWRKDGKELFYLALDGKLVSVEVRLGSSAVETGIPKVLFQTNTSALAFWQQYCVTGDGQKFLVIEALSQAVEPFNVILNWTAVMGQ